MGNGRLGCDGECEGWGIFLNFKHIIFLNFKHIIFLNFECIIFLNFECIIFLNFECGGQWAMGCWGAMGSVRVGGFS